MGLRERLRTHPVIIVTFALPILGLLGIQGYAWHRESICQDIRELSERGTSIATLLKYARDNGIEHEDDQEAREIVLIIRDVKVPVVCTCDRVFYVRYDEANRIIGMREKLNEVCL